MSTSTGKSLMVPGRLVWSSGPLFKGKVKTDEHTRQPILDKRTGNPIIEYGFGLAIPKSEFEQGKPGAALWLAMYEQAYEIYSNRQLPSDFAFKYKDGDSIDPKGISFAQRTGYAGCLVFACTTRIPIKFFRWESTPNFTGNVQIEDGIKVGDYVNAQLNIVAHPPEGRGKAGLYVNPVGVQLVRVGEAIVNAPSGDQIFGAVAPSGMDYTQAPPPMSGMTQIPMQPPAYGAPQPMPNQPMAQPMPMQQQQAQPHYPVLPQHFQPPQSQPAQPPAYVPPQGQPTNGYVQPQYPASGIPPMPR